MDRRGFLAALPALLTAGAARASAAPPIRIRGINHVTVVVPDLKRAVDFYQGLFGFPKERRNRTVDAGLRIGPGLGIDLTTDRPDLTPRIDHFCFGIENFDVGRVVKALEEHGLTKSDERGPMKVQLSTRDGATLVYAGDPDGVSVQLQDYRYCGGTGPFGNECVAPEPPPRNGLLTIRGYTGVTLTAREPDRSVAFYRELFGQVPLSIAAGRGTIEHFSFKVERFDRDRVAKALESYDVHPRAGEGPRDRDTLFFTDLNGILIQLS